jgi:hypothetical protein
MHEPVWIVLNDYYQIYLSTEKQLYIKKKKEQIEKRMDLFSSSLKSSLEVN